MQARILQMAAAKQWGLGEFKKGLGTIAQGGTYFGPGVAALLRTVVANNGSSAGIEALTDREREILKLDEDFLFGFHQSLLWVALKGQSSFYYPLK